ncbi:MAG: cytochrome c3 family protein [bacterium]
MKKGRTLFCAAALLCGGFQFANSQEVIEYAGASTCRFCHAGSLAADQHTPWLATKHAVAYDSVAAFSEFLRNKVQRTAECLQCHTTGWDTTRANFGADDFVQVDYNLDEFNISFATDNDSIKFNVVKNVQCESCHGPAFDHIRDFRNVKPPKILGAEVCGACHQDKHHPYFEEWSLSRHAEADTSSSGFLTSKFRNDPECSGCHTFQGFIQFVGTTLDDTLNVKPHVETPPADDALPLVCAACHDPHEARHEAQLRIPPQDLCVKCHNPENAVPPAVPHHSTGSMFAGTGAVEFEGIDYTFARISAHQVLGATAEKKCVACHVFQTPFEQGPPEVAAVTGHTFQPRKAACGQSNCHVGPLELEIPPGSGFKFDHRGTQTFTQTMLDSLEKMLANIQNNILPTGSAADSLNYQKGLFNFQFVNNDGSRGVHNANYAEIILKTTVDFLNKSFVTAVEPVVASQTGLPKTFALQPNFPNPFNPTTRIRFDVPKSSHVKLIVFNARGQQVATLVDERLQRNSYEIEFNASRLSSGIYFYKLVADNFTTTRKMIVIK